MNAESAVATPSLTWPDADFAKTPYRVFVDQGIFDLEMERIFRGPTWSYLGLECEVANAGDYLTGYIGTTPVVLSRESDGALSAFVNRCSHRGMQVVRELRGNRSEHICPYHQWSYDSGGRLQGVPFQKGAGGRGGLPADFQREKHGMTRLRVASLAGAVFGTLSDEAPSLEDYLGPAITARMQYAFPKRLRVSGYHRNSLRTNWKLFAENSRDAYHAPLLHPFLPAFGLMRSTDTGKVQTNREGYHSLISVWSNKSGAAESRGEASGRFTLKDPSLVRGFQEYADGLALNIISIFPSTLFTCVGNTLSVRQIRPKEPGRVELLYTFFGFEDDTDEQRSMRRKQNNLFGPAGYVAIEDVEALELIQSSIARGEEKRTSVLSFGGTSRDETDHVLTDVSIRGFWRGYCGLMGFEPAAQAK